MLLTIVFASAVLCTACDHSGNSYSMLPDSQSFGQAASAYTINNKLDVLWVVDNSGSMLPLQNTLVKNFTSFISTFQNKGYDFRIAVTSTDAYLADKTFQNSPTLSKFRDGQSSSPSGVSVIYSTTPNLVPTFVNNASLGQSGSGDERAFASLKSSLSNSLNAGFPRADAFMVVIILSDEDDFSDATRPEYSWLQNGGVADHSYTNPHLDTVDSHIAFLDKLTNSTPANRHYNVSAITVLDNTCLTSHVGASPTAIIGQRYIDIANKTKGTLGSICAANYANAIAQIQQQAIELSTQFFLNRTPATDSLQIIVNNVTVASDPTNGWTYDAVSNSITFHGTSVPQQGATITVNFVPNQIKN